MMGVAPNHGGFTENAYRPTSLNLNDLDDDEIEIDLDEIMNCDDIENCSLMSNTKLAYNLVETLIHSMDEKVLSL